MLLSTTASGAAAYLQGLLPLTPVYEWPGAANEDEVCTLTYRGRAKAGNTATCSATDPRAPDDQGAAAHA